MLAVARGTRVKVVGLVGETGAGKSLTALSVLGLLQSTARIVAGSIRFDDVELNASHVRNVAPFRVHRQGLDSDFVELQKERI